MVVRCALLVVALLCSVSFVSCFRLGLTCRRLVLSVRCVSLFFLCLFVFVRLVAFPSWFVLSVVGS